MQPNLAPQTETEIIAMLTQALLLAHRYLIQRGDTPATINLPVEMALFQAGIGLHQLYMNSQPAAANDATAPAQ